MVWQKKLLKKLGLKWPGQHEQFPDGKEGIKGESGCNFGALKWYGREIVGEVGKVVERNEEVTRVKIILSRKTKNNPLVVGELGESKNAVVRGLADMIARGHVPSNLKNVRVIALDIGRLAEGAKDTIEFEKRLKAILKEAQEAAGKVILFIDKIHLLFGGGRAELSKVAGQVLKPMLATGQLWCIGGTDSEGHRKYLEKDVVFEEHFEKVLLIELIPSSRFRTGSTVKGLDELRANLNATYKFWWAPPKAEKETYEVMRHYKPELVDRLDENANEGENSCSFACACGCCNLYLQNL